MVLQTNSRFNGFFRGLQFYNPLPNIFILIVEDGEEPGF